MNGQERHSNNPPESVKTHFIRGKTSSRKETSKGGKEELKKKGKEKVLRKKEKNSGKHRGVSGTGCRVKKGRAGGKNPLTKKKEKKQELKKSTKADRKKRERGGEGGNGRHERK